MVVVVEWVLVVVVVVIRGLVALFASSLVRLVVSVGFVARLARASSSLLLPLLFSLSPSVWRLLLLVEAALLALWLLGVLLELSLLSWGVGGGLVWVGGCVSYSVWQVEMWSNVLVAVWSAEAIGSGA